MITALTTSECWEVLGAVGPTRQSARGPTRRVPCPSHNDRHPSCDVTDAAGRTLFCCRAGCSQSEIIEALRNRGLWAATSPVQRAPIVDWAAALTPDAPT